MLVVSEIFNITVLKIWCIVYLQNNYILGRLDECSVKTYQLQNVKFDMCSLKTTSIFKHLE